MKMRVWICPGNPQFYIGLFNDDDVFCGDGGLWVDMDGRFSIGDDHPEKENEFWQGWEEVDLGDYWNRIIQASFP